MERTVRAMRPRLRVCSRRLDGLLRQLAALQGYELTREGPADVWVYELGAAPTLPRLPRQTPWLAVSPSRLRAYEVAACYRAGAHRVLDGRACLWELTVALGELMPATGGRCWVSRRGGLPVRLAGPSGAVEGQLMNLRPSGGRLRTDAPLAVGQPCALQIPFGSGSVQAEGRVAFTAGQELGLEFSLPGPSDATSLSTLSGAAPAARCAQA